MKFRAAQKYWTLIVAARVASAIKELLLAAVFGTSGYKDALVAAWSLPALLSGYVNECLAPVLTPAWTGEARGIGSAAWALGAQAILTAAVLCAPRFWLHALAPGLDPRSMALAVQLERWMAANIFLLALQSIAGAWWNAKRAFSWPPGMLLLATLTVIADILATGKMALAERVLWIGAAITVGNAAAAAPGAWRLWQAHRCRLATGIKDGGRLGALLAGVALVNAVDWIDRIAASRLPSGSLAGLDYGERVTRLLFSVTVVPYCVLAFTHLAETADVDAWFRRMRHGLYVIAVAGSVTGLMLAAGTLFWSAHGWTVGHFNGASLALTAPLLGVRGAGLGLDAVVYFLLFAAYSRQRTGAKLTVGAVIAAINLPLDFVLSARMGLVGIAWAHVAAYAVAAPVAWIQAVPRVSAWAEAQA